MEDHESEARRVAEYWDECADRNRRDGLTHEQKLDELAADYWHCIWHYHHVYNQAGKQ